MATRSTTAPTQYRNDVFSALSHPRRRTALRVLDRLDGATYDELATRVAAAESDTAPAEVTSDETERVKRRLVHGHLPKLINAGLVTDVDGTVAATEHPAFRDPAITAMLERDASDPDAVLSCLADERRRIVVATLVERDEQMDLADLAAAVADERRDGADRDDDAEGNSGDDQPPDAAEKLRIELHHAHLPKLDAARLVRYDADAETVTLDGHPDLNEAWLESRGGPSGDRRDATEIPL